MYRRVDFLLAIVSIASISCSPGPQSSRQPSSTAAIAATPAAAPVPLVRLLTDPELWGPDFPLVITLLPAADREGDTTLAVFPSRVLGSRNFASPDAAEAAAARLSEAYAEAKNAPRPGISALVDSTLRNRSAPKVVMVPDPEASALRVGWSSNSLQFLPRALRVVTLRGRLGQPDSVTRLVIDNGGERRPVILTLYHYANDAVLFAESDWSPTPGLIDRVYLSVPRLTAALFQEAR
jgi:hypothetical protein